MGNTCTSCCRWLYPAEQDATTKAKLGKDGASSTWFEEDSVPLITARLDDEIESECVVKKTIVMRSPRLATETTDRSVRGEHRQSFDDSRGSSAKPRDGARESRSASHHSSSPTHRHKHRSTGLRPVDQPDDQEKPDSKSQLGGDDDVSDLGTSTRSLSASHASSSADDDEPRVSLHTVESTSRVTIQSAVSSMEAKAHASHHQHGDNTGQQVEFDDDQGNDEQASPRSARASSGSTSPKKKRYGRKNYRANSNRKKTN